MRKMSTVALLLMTVPGLSLAQEACGKLLEHGMTNTVNYTNSDSYLVSIRDAYCSESYVTMDKRRQDSFEVVVKSIPMGYRGESAKTSEQHTSFCRDFRQVSSGDRRSDYASRQMVRDAIDAWRDCIALSSAGTVVLPTFTADMAAVDFALSATRSQTTLNGVDTREATCRIDGRALREADTIPVVGLVKSVRCTRTSRPITLFGATSDYYPPANVKLKLASGDIRVDFPEMLSGPAASRIAGLEAQVTRLTDELAHLGLGKGGSNQRAVNPHMGDGKPHACPAGSYVSMLQADTGVGGRYANDGISGITITCTPLRAPASAVANAP